MYPFPPAEELQFLLDGDCVLTQIIIDPYGLTLIFENDCYVSVEHAMTFRSADGTSVTYGSVWANEPPIAFHRLLQKRLLALAREDFLLTLSLEDGDSLQVHSELSPYECGHVASPSTMLVF